jgi:hypothetical protein
LLNSCNKAFVEENRSGYAPLPTRARAAPRFTRRCRRKAGLTIGTGSTLFGGRLQYGVRATDPWSTFRTGWRDSLACVEFRSDSILTSGDLTNHRVYDDVVVRMPQAIRSGGSQFESILTAGVEQRVSPGVYETPPGPDSRIGVRDVASESIRPPAGSHRQSSTRFPPSQARSRQHRHRSVPRRAALLEPIEDTSDTREQVPPGCSEARIRPSVRSEAR